MINMEDNSGPSESPRVLAVKIRQPPKRNRGRPRKGLPKPTPPPCMFISRSLGRFLHHDRRLTRSWQLNRSRKRGIGRQPPPMNLVVTPVCSIIGPDLPIFGYILSANVSMPAPSPKKTRGRPRKYPRQSKSEASMFRPWPNLLHDC